jgi:hypothetical protein
MRIFRFLPGVNEEGPFVERLEGGPGQRLGPAGRRFHDARLVVVFHAAHFDGVGGVDGLLVGRAARGRGERRLGP